MVPSINEIRNAALTAKLKRFVAEAKSGPVASGLSEDYTLSGNALRLNASRDWGVQVVHATTGLSALVPAESATVDAVYEEIAKLIN